jgi:Protein of unknown function (DUF3515)
LLAGPGGDRGAAPALASGSRSPLAPVTVSAPPSSDSATLSACARVIGAMPLSLAGADVRATASDPASPDIVAWGDPPIVLRCGVARPPSLKPADSDFIVAVDGVNLLPRRRDGATRYTVIDRAVYLDVSVPSAYRQPPLGPIADVVAKELKPVCQVADPTGATTVPDAELCTHRR